MCKNTATNQSSEVKLAENYEGLPPEIEKLSERLAKDPKSLVFSSLANAYRKHNMVDEAIEILQKGLEIHPNYASARIVLGKCYVDKRMYELAKEQFMKALESDSQNIVVLENLGNVYKTLNQYNDAFDIFKKLLDLDPLNETFEREVAELKGLAKDISDTSGQYDTFQTIPSQNAVDEQPEKPSAATSEPEPEPQSNAPTLSDLFKGAPDAPEETPPQEAAAPEAPEATTEKPKIINTAADFSDMFEPKTPEEAPPEKQETPVIEQAPAEAPVEEKPIVEQSVPLEKLTEEETPLETTEVPPIIHGSPTIDMMQQEASAPPPFEKAMQEPEPPPEVETPKEDTFTAPQTESLSEPSSEEDAGFGAITSAFDDGGLDKAPEPTKEDMKDSLAPETEAIVSELSEELSREEQPPPEAPSETAPPIPEETVIEIQPTAPEAPVEAAPVMEKPPETYQQPAATETLAEIYLSQGFNDKALQIYRELLVRDPENELLKQKVASLEQQLSAESTPPPQSPPEEPPPEGEEKDRSDQERRTQSKNLDSFQDWLKKFQK
jgi:tetratricopeptide (TPR) repeat protein